MTQMRSGRKFGNPGQTFGNTPLSRVPIDHHAALVEGGFQYTGQNRHGVHTYSGPTNGVSASHKDGITHIVHGKSLGVSGYHDEVSEHSDASSIRRTLSKGTPRSRVAGVVKGVGRVIGRGARYIVDRLGKP